MKASGYFDSQRFALRNGDLIWVNGSDGIGQLTVTSAVNDTTVTTSLFAGAGSVDTADIADLAVTTAKIADDAVTLAKMAAGTAGNLITYDASGNPAAVATGTATHVLTSNGAGAAPTFQAAGGGGVTTIASVTMSAAELIASYTTPFQLVAPPAANEALIFLYAFIEYYYGTTQFTGGGSGYQIQYNSATPGSAAASEAVAATTITAYPVDATIFIPMYSSALPSPAVGWRVGAGLYLSRYTASGAFADGDGSFKVHVAYQTITTSF